MQNDGGGWGVRIDSCASVHALCAKSVEQVLNILMLPHSFLKMPGCGLIYSKFENQTTGNEATEGAVSLPVINCRSRLDEAFFQHLLIAEPQVGDVG